MNIVEDLVLIGVSEFKSGCASTNDENRSGRPVEVTSSKMFNKIHDVVLSDRRIKVRDIVEATGISQGTVFSILHEKLGVKKSRQDGAAFALNGEQTQSCDQFDSWFIAFQSQS
ncbi:hypothetical protein AVEN_135524-1 [Araneus ventricosus]|uniref:Uncharacterized protein n=1 Tax=Araneus ventricosus TaxID=182803 RepID=A0A4Y2NQ76_ARAVE|nr:hypothetical protein AVEN_135524-1 [Araneus ventricosus]